MNWEDTTSYTQSDKERIPRIWQLRIGKMRLVVHRHLHHDPDQWLMTVHGDINIDNRPLLQKDLDKAKREALAALHNTLDRLCRDVAAVMYK